MKRKGDIHPGGCLCGSVRFEVTGKPNWIVNCHCQSCRRHTASPMATFAGFTDQTFRFTQGEPKVFESSPETWRSFCGECGTPLVYRANWDKGGVHVYIGAFDDPGAFPPMFHVNFAEHVAWFDTADDLRRYRSMDKGNS